MSNPFAALEEVSEGSSNQSKKQEKKTEQPKVQPKVQEKPKTTEKPKETTTEKPKPKPKPQTDKPVSGVTQDGFEQVGKTQRGGRPQRGQSERGRGSSRGSRGGDRGSRGSGRGGRGGFNKPPRTDSNTGSEQTVVKDVREDSEKHTKPKGEFRNERTGEPRQGNARGRGRFHDHHLSGTGTRGGMKKRGGGGHNWGNPIKDDVVEGEVSKEVEVETETTEEKKEEVVDPKNMTEDQKKAFRKKRKEAEKKQRKGVKKDDKATEKSDELSIDQVKVTKVDPNQKTFEEYQKEKSKKTTEEKKEEVKKPTTGIDVSQLFKSGPTSGDKKKTTTSTKTKSVPKVTDKNDFPTLK